MAGQRSSKEDIKELTNAFTAHPIDLTFTSYYGMLYWVYEICPVGYLVGQYVDSYAEEFPALENSLKANARSLCGGGNRGSFSHGKTDKMNCACIYHHGTKEEDPQGNYYFALWQQQGKWYWGHVLLENWHYWKHFAQQASSTHPFVAQGLWRELVKAAKIHGHYMMKEGVY